MADRCSVYTVNEAYSHDVEAPPLRTESTNVARGGRPPSYSQGPPPSYESLNGRVKAARDESSGTGSFLETFFTIILCTIVFTILTGIFLGVPVSMIVMGAVYQDDCPFEPMIPIYLIVAGSFGAAIILYSLIRRCRKDEKKREDEQDRGDEPERFEDQTLARIINAYAWLVALFLVAWFIAGCVYIYRTKDDFVTEPKESDKYCDPTLYWFAFWITTAVYIIMAASCCCVGCVWKLRMWYIKAH